MSDTAIASRASKTLGVDGVADDPSGTFFYRGFLASPLSDLVERHVGGGTPSRAVAGYWNGDIPWASVKDFTDDQAELQRTQESVTHEGLHASASNLIPEGVPLVCTRMAVGRAALSAMPVAINQDIKALFPKVGVDPKYLIKLLHYIQPKAEAVSVGSTVKGIRVKDYLGLEIPLAPIRDQPIIAQVLDTLDTAIRQTEAIIAKLKLVKQGLLHDLLTRGIDANGELRPPQSQAPHLYKQSPLGWMPKEWKIETIDACSDVVDCPHSTPRFLDKGVLVARTMHIKDGTFLEFQASHVSEPEYRQRIARREPQPGDLIFTREAPVGEAFVIPAAMKICLGQRVVLLCPQRHRLVSEYLLAQICSGAVKDRIATLTSGTTNPHLNVPEIKQLEIPLPPFDEQLLIAGRMAALESRLQSEMHEREKFEALKSGLMDDLLTGRVRVTSLLEEITP